MTLGVGVDHVIDAACACHAAGSAGEDSSEVVVTAEALPGVPIRITKYATYQTSRSTPAPELVDRCRRTLDRAVSGGFDAIAAVQREQFDRFWDRADVRVQAKHDPVGSSRRSSGICSRSRRHPGGPRGPAFPPRG